MVNGWFASDGFTQSEAVTMFISAVAGFMETATVCKKQSLWINKSFNCSIYLLY